MKNQSPESRNVTYGNALVAILSSLVAALGKNVDLEVLSKELERRFDQYESTGRDTDQEVADIIGQVGEWLEQFQPLQEPLSK